MEVLKLETQWAKHEVFSTRFFILFAILFLIASVSFWQLGKTQIARAYIVTTLIAGVLVMIVGLGLFFTNKARISQFEKAFTTHAPSFFESEMEPTQATLNQYKTVFKVIPILIIAAALLFIFIQSPTWRAISITTIAMLTIILLIDATAHSRIKAYHKKLKLVAMENKI